MAQLHGVATNAAYLNYVRLTSPVSPAGAIGFMEVYEWQSGGLDYASKVEIHHYINGSGGCV